jgi:hypothetical protein
MVREDCLKGHFISQLIYYRFIWLEICCSLTIIVTELARRCWNYKNYKLIQSAKLYHSKWDLFFKWYNVDNCLYLEVRSIIVQHRKFALSFIRSHIVFFWVYLERKFIWKKKSTNSKYFLYKFRWILFFCSVILFSTHFYINTVACCKS